MSTSTTPVSRRSGLRGPLPRMIAILVSAMVVLSGCGSIYDLPLPGGADVGSNPITVHVEFRDVLDLVPQTTVKVDDVTVGNVKAIKLKGYTADVTIQLPRSVDLPDNAEATIRQTSLLGEKFVSLAPPASGASSNKLGNGDVIPLSRTGRNPEVEEVLGALALLLNGGGVGQLKTIASEFNTVLGGRESDVRSVLDQLRSFMGQLAANKVQIVRSISSLNRLAVQFKKQDGSIKLALDNLPSALHSINGQRKDLVRTLQALDKLSNVGVKVIKASKQSTINSLRDLSPVLDKLAAAGQDLPNALQVLLPYPFVDAAVGRDPQVARNLHMGDYTNLSARLDVNLAQLPKLPGLPALPGLPGQVCATVKQVSDAATKAANTALATIPANPLLTAAKKKQIRNKIVARLVKELKGQCKAPDPTALARTAQDLLPSVLKLVGLGTLPPIKLPPVKLPPVKVPPIGGGGGIAPPPLPGGLGLNRTGTSFGAGRIDIFNGPVGGVDKLGYNSTLGSLLLQGVER